MIEMENKKDLVSFEYEGKTYVMTQEEIEAAYRYQEQQYRKCDAEVLGWRYSGRAGALESRKSSPVWVERYHRIQGWWGDEDDPVPRLLLR